MYTQSSSSFPFISDIETIKGVVTGKPEIRFQPRSNGYTDFIVGCYMISKEDTFDNDWARECRGITFNQEGQVVSRPLHKFFNVNEREETRFENIDWRYVTRIMNKLDGSMISTVYVGEGNSPFEGNTFDIKSKKAFDSPVCISAREYIQQKDNIKNLCYFYAGTHTLVFEYTSPQERIVIAYPEPKLTLLHMRSNDTGEYVKYPVLKHIADEFGVDLVSNDDTMLSEINSSENVQQYLLDKVAHTEGIEGWVFQLNTGEMFKLKTKWYMDRHHAFTALRERDIAKLVVDESIDDLKSKLVSDGIDIGEILDIEQGVVSRINGIQQAVATLYEANKHLDRKSLALSLKGNVYFGMVMALYSGKNVDYKEFFKKYYLDEEYSLRSLKMNDQLSGD
jgi:RNA ligase